MKLKHYFIAVLIGILFLGGWYYVTFPVVNIHESSFWGSVILVCIVLGVIFLLAVLAGKGKKLFSKKKNKFNTSVLYGEKLPKIALLFFGLAGISVIVLVVGAISSMELFRAKSYANLIKVETCDFAKDMEESTNVTDIALMDTNSARTFGERKIGSLSEVVSQYEVDEDYNQINAGGKPMKVAALQYASFFKWFNNRGEGIPGYVQVNPVNSDSDYVKLTKGMKYTPSAYFNYNLQRHIRFHYPTKIIEQYYFEVDDEGNPYYICPELSPRVGLFGARDVKGAVICDPITGDTTYYKVADIPAWVDRVYDGNLLTQKYDWHAMLSGGYWNSIISQSGCKQTTDDYGYKIIGDDVWVYTGVTSVTGDQSNVGFVLMNQRTSKTQYFNVSGAEEHSAMSAAEGEVQEKGYEAAFPSLINVSGQPTYIMVLKDSGGLVKMYAMVNVEQYNIVATGTSQEAVFAAYKKKLASEGDSKDAVEEIQEKTITISDVQFITIDGETMVYLKDGLGHVYKQAFSDNEELIKLSVGDSIHIKYISAENDINLIDEIIE